MPPRVASSMSEIPGDGAASLVPSPLPGWFRPWRLLVLFTYAMLLVWVDQGTFSSASVMVRRYEFFKNNATLPRPRI